MEKSYTKIYALILCFSFLSISSFAQKSQSLWTKSSLSEVLSQNKLYQQNEPAVVNYYKLNLQNLTSTLQSAPQKGTVTSNVVLDFPNIDGKMESFRIEEYSNMDPALQAQFPEIKAYIGTGITNPAAILRFSVSPEKGLSSMVLSDNKTLFIEPYSEDLTTYRVYIRTAADINTSTFICETDLIDQPNVSKALSNFAGRNANDGKLRTFRLALACTGEYATFHGGTVPNVVAAMNASMTRVNGVFERDVAIRMVLVANNTNVIFLNAGTDPYTNNNGGAMLDQNLTTCNTQIGTANYDIGHVFSTGGGGVAQLSSPCGSGKARGVTGQGAPVGDTFDIDYVAHEMGHQYGANHTQNNNCQRSSKSFEPGSASTIMGYAGICAPNVQNNSDDYFHGESIREMWANISAGNSQCAVQSNTNNAAPVANAGANYNIPRSTPFVLRGAATDANTGNVLTYCWEQLDATPATMPPVSTSTAGPAFRSLSPTTSPNRYMPAFPTVLAGSTASTWEVVPSVGRTMNFNLTVRDNVAGGSGSSSDGMLVTVNAASGPFVVTSQSSNVTWDTGSSQEVIWNVANTTAAPVSTANVNILMSTDGGLTFPITLASNVPNDGSQNVTVPNNITSQARIIVEGAGNIFYAVNSSNFTIVQAEFILNFASSDVSVCQPNNAAYNFTYNTFLGFSGTTTFSASNLPAGASVAFSPPTATADGTNVTMTVSNTGAIAPGTYTITATGTSGAISNSVDLTLNVFSNSINVSTLVSPADGATGVPSDGNLVWNADPNAEDYFVEVATDAGFTNIINSATVADALYTTSLSTNTLYYWRVTASNQCATAAPSAVRSFRTANISCESFSATGLPIAISANGTPTITSVINVASNFPITDVNVGINITHSWDSDLTITLTSPNGTVVELSSQNGGDGDNYTNTVFDQQATNPITGGTPPFTGTYVPEGNLSSLNGEMSGGNWTLTVADGANQDGGSLLNYNLDLCVQGTLSVAENEFKDFVIFPNPNHGEFTIKLNPSSSSNIRVEVYDIRGRVIYNTLYGNSSEFNQTIKLNNAQSGIYLVKVSDGERQTTKKIIVN